MKEYPLTMKHLVLVLLVLSTLFSCGTAQTEGGTSKEEAKDSLQIAGEVVAPPKEEPVASLESIWMREFTFENPGPKEGKWETGNTYYLDPRNNALDIAGYSMGCPRAKISAYFKFSPEQMVVVFKEYKDKIDIDGRGFPKFESGDVLLILTKDDNGFSTEWKKLNPLYGEVASTCRCFE